MCAFVHKVCALFALTILRLLIRQQPTRQVNSITLWDTTKVTAK